MKQRKPMSRGKGFQRKQVADRTPRGNEATCGFPADSGAFEHQQVAALKPLRRGTYAAPDIVKPISKTEAHRNPHLLAMARGKPCLFRLPGICNFDPETTVACHSNLGIHGKGGARKADDEYSAWGCFACHAHIDQGGIDHSLAVLIFMEAHLAQVEEWRAIAGSRASEPRDRAAAHWALDHLGASPVGLLESPL